MAASSAAKQAKWLDSLLTEMGDDTRQEPTIIYTDNKGSLAHSSNPVNHKLAKHINVKHHIVCKHVNDGLIAMEHVPGTECTADISTKPLPKHALCEKDD